MEQQGSCGAAGGMTVEQSGQFSFLVSLFTNENC